jgi:hypothetical protein
VKIGDYVQMEAVMNQTDHKWVVLSPLTIDEYGDVSGGCVFALEHLVSVADKKASAARKNGERALVVQGLTPGVIVGGVFVT